MTKTKVLMTASIALLLAGCSDVRNGWYYLSGQEAQPVTATTQPAAPAQPSLVPTAASPAASTPGFVAKPTSAVPAPTSAETTDEDKIVRKPLATEPDIVSIKLAQAANKAAEALDRIAAVEQYRNPAVPSSKKELASASGPFMEKVSLRWSGPIDQITRVLAERAGLRFRASGRAPSIPLVVNIDAYQQPILYVLRDIGLQAGSRADLLVNQNQGIVEVRYAAADQSR